MSCRVQEKWASRIRVTCRRKAAGGSGSGGSSGSAQRQRREKQNVACTCYTNRQSSDDLHNLMICFFMARSPRQYGNLWAGSADGGGAAPASLQDAHVGVLAWTGRGGAVAMHTQLTTQHCRRKASSRGRTLLACMTPRHGCLCCLPVASPDGSCWRVTIYHTCQHCSM